MSVMEEEIKRRAARRKSALVLEIIRARPPFRRRAASSTWRRPKSRSGWSTKAGMENALRAKPEDVREQYERQLKDLQEAYGEAMLELRARKKCSPCWDTLDPRALRLSQALLGRHMTSAWDLAMIDLNVFESQADPDGLLIVPELLGTVHAEVRHVVHVAVEGDSSRARVTVEHVTSEGESPSRPPRIGSREEFLGMVDASSREVVARILDRFQQVSDASGGAIHWGFRAATANLYWRTPGGGSRRILTISRGAAFRVWLGYLMRQGYLRETELVREQARRLVQIESGDQSGQVLPDAENIEAVLELIDGVARGLAAPTGR